MEIAKHVRFHFFWIANIFSTNSLHLQSNYSHKRFTKKIILNICCVNESVEGRPDVINSRNFGDCSVFFKRIMCAEIITTLLVLSCEYLRLFIIIMHLFTDPGSES